LAAIGHFCPQVIDSKHAKWPTSAISLNRGAVSDISIIPNTTIQTQSGENLELGTWLGRKQAFAELAAPTPGQPQNGSPRRAR
jgi:hypothetical protein